MFLFVNIAHERKILNTETRAFVEWDPGTNPSDGKDRNGKTWQFGSAARDVVFCLEANSDRVLGWDPVGNRPAVDHGRTLENYANGGSVVPAAYKATEPVKATVPDDHARRARRSASDDRRNAR